MLRDAPNRDLRDISATVASQHELLLQAWECALAGTSTVYLSGPITTGPRFLNWYRTEGRRLPKGSKRYKVSLQREVIDPNCDDIRRTANQLRAQFHEPILEPASLFVADWTQDEYLVLWSRVIERYIARIVVMSGWQYSAGCSAELLRAYAHDLPVSSVDGGSLPLQSAIEILDAAAKDVDEEKVPIANLGPTLDALRGLQSRGGLFTFSSESDDKPIRKDVALDRLADVINVAQFVSFSPSRKGLKQEYCRVLGFQPGHHFSSLRHALGALLERSAEKSINLRSYTPESPQSREFIYGIRSIDEAVSSAERLASEGLFLIANETVDIHDGGVSGVAMGDVLEFAPDDTPRGVEKPGIASLPRLWGVAMLTTVYGFAPDINVARASRLEFSLHPKPRGWRNTHTLGWEYEETAPLGLSAKLSWPNRFSRMIGDKVFGLLVAHLAGLPVPHTTVVNRRVAPFAFGRPTGSAEIWLRTSPHEQVPGKFTTTKGWTDAFALLSDEDPSGTEIASVLSQAAVPSLYAGAAIVSGDDQLVIEGASGEGDAFMLGEALPERLPYDIIGRVKDLHDRAAKLLGPVRFEWVFDGHTVWVVQLHRGSTQSSGDVLVPGDAAHWVKFDVRQGLEQLRKVVAALEPGAGLILQGEVGLTSHIADVIRRAGVPTRLGPA